MRRMLAALAAAALLGCGGDEVRFDLDSPPKWLTDLDAALPAKALRRDELSAGCLASFARQCTAQVRPSRAMARKAKFALVQGTEVRIVYEAGEGASPVIVTLRDKPATVPLRRSGGTLTFVCRKSIDPCAVDMVR